MVTARQRCQRGFTLIELMVTISIAAILMAIAVPSFRNYQASQQVRSTAEDLVSALNIARSEAIKRSANVTTSPITGSDWNTGWRVTIAGPSTLREYAAVNGVTVTYSGANVPVYGSSGRLTTGGAVNFTVAPVGASVSSRCVKISLSGQPISQSGACS